MTLSRDKDRLATIAAVTAAFEGTAREGGISLHEASEIDLYGTDEDRAAARLLDTECRWQEVPDRDIEEEYTALYFLDRVGFRYSVDQHQAVEELEALVPVQLLGRRGRRRQGLQVAHAPPDAPGYSVCSSPRMVALGDFNGDKKLDLAVACVNAKGVGSPSPWSGCWRKSRKAWPGGRPRARRPPRNRTAAGPRPTPAARKKAGGTTTRAEIGQSGRRRRDRFDPRVNFRGWPEAEARDPCGLATASTVLHRDQALVKQKALFGLTCRQSPVLAPPRTVGAASGRRCGEARPTSLSGMPVRRPSFIARTPTDFDSGGARDRPWTVSLVPVDGPGFAEHALPWALGIAPSGGCGTGGGPGARPT
jgi:hypothetical protein